MMRGHMRTSLRLACVLSAASAALLALAPAGCKSSQDGARGPVESQAGPQATTRTITLGGDGGGGGGLAMSQTKPDDFPKDIPMYPGSTVTLGGRSTGTGRRSWTLTATTGDTRDQAASRYKDILSGFEKVTDLNMGDTALSIWRSAAYDMTLMIGSAADGKTTITLNVASK
jgi:hypothetical protein